MERNTQPITKELSEDNTLVFFPQTDQEAESIVRKLINLGCKRYLSDGTTTTDVGKDYLFEFVESGLRVSQGLISLPDPEDTEDGLLCTLDQFDAPSEKTKSQINKEEPKRNTQPITKELSEDNTLVFLPQTDQEAGSIVRKLIDLGCKRYLADGTTTTDIGESHLFEFVESGLRVSKGLISLAEDKRGGLLCTADQFNSLAEMEELAGLDWTTGADLDDTEGLFAAMFPKGQPRTLTAVWNVLAGAVMDNPALKVDNDQAEEGRLKISSSNGRSIRVDHGRGEASFSVYESENNRPPKTVNGLSVPAVADTLIEFIRKNRGGPRL